MDGSVDFNELQRVVGRYVDQYNLVVAAGPVTAASVLKAFAGKNKMVNLAVVGGGAWFAIQELSGPAMRFIETQFGSLQSIMGGFRG